MDRVFTSLAVPATGLSRLNFISKADGAKFKPPIAIHAMTEPTKSDVRIGMIMNARLNIFLWTKCRNVCLSVKTPFSQDSPSLISVCNQFIKFGLNRVTMQIKTKSVTVDVSSWLCGTCPLDLAFCSLLGVGCSVFSATGPSAIGYSRFQQRIRDFFGIAFWLFGRGLIRAPVFPLGWQIRQRMY